MMNKKSARNIRIWTFIIIVIALNAYMMITEIRTFFAFEPPKYCIFNDISECENIVVQATEGTEIIRYSTPNGDKNLNNLEYKEFWGAYYSSSEIELDIYAYVFKDTETAKAYFSFASDRDAEGNVDMRGYSNEKQGYYVLVSHEKAYIAYTTDLDSFCSVEGFFEKYFSVELDLTQ